MNTICTGSEERDLLSAFSRPPEIIARSENRFLVRGRVDTKSGSDSYATVSWDHYFDDLSRGGFRKHIDGNHYVSRRRAWHFLFKQLKLVEALYAHPSKSVRVLDVGCSSGYLRRFIEGNHSPNDVGKISYWGLDVRADMLRRAVFSTDDIESGALGNFTPSAFIQHDVKFGLPFTDEFFDYAVNFEMIKYLPVDQCELLIAETHRCLKPGGAFYLSFPTDYEHYSSRARYQRFARALPASEIERMLKSNGFGPVEVYGSQSKYRAIEPAISDAHRPVFDQMLNHHPREIVAAMFAPLYPDVCAQVTFRSRKNKPAESVPAKRDCFRTASTGAA